MNTLTFIACRRCSNPVVRSIDRLTITADPTALTPHQEAHAWLTNTSTYKVLTIGRRQLLQWRHPNPPNARELVTHIAAGTTPHRTILATHHCPSTPNDLALLDWQPRDRQAALPRPPRPSLPEEAPF